MMEKIKLWIYLFFFSFTHSFLDENETFPLLYIDNNESKKNKIGKNGTILFYPDYFSEDIENMIDTNKKSYLNSIILDVNDI